MVKSLGLLELIAELDEKTDDVLDRSGVSLLGEQRERIDERHELGLASAHPLELVDHLLQIDVALLELQEERAFRRFRRLGRGHLQQAREARTGGLGGDGGLRQTELVHFLERSSL